MTPPDFFIIGVPKAGTAALHSALASHPGIVMSPMKEPKFFVGEDERPIRQPGHGDAHEQICALEDYETPNGREKGKKYGESAPYYLYDFAAHDAIARVAPKAKLVIVMRDPIERAHSSWLQLRAEGLEAESDFLTACSLEVKRISDGWGPFCHYLQLGRYGEQLQHLLTRFPRRQVAILRYLDLIDNPARSIDRIRRFLGVKEGVSEPIVRELRDNLGPRPRIAPEDRRLLLEAFEDDIRLLEDLTRFDLSDWRDENRFGFRSRKQLAHA
jgi:hypothetical protein